MPRSNIRKKNSQLNCQHCGRNRIPLHFYALNVNSEGKVEKEDVIPFQLRPFLDMIQGKKMLQLPKFYCMNCSVCFKTTFYKGQNRGTKLEVIPT